MPPTIGQQETGLTKEQILASLASAGNAKAQELLKGSPVAPTTQPFRIEVPTREVPAKIIGAVGQDRRMVESTLSTIQKQKEEAEAQKRALEEKYLVSNAPTERELALQEELNRLNGQQRTIEEASYNEQVGLEGQGRGITLASIAGQAGKIRQNATKELRNVQLQRLASSDELSTLTGVRQNALDSLKTQMGFEDTRFERLLGVEKDLQNMTKTQKEQARNDLSSILEFSTGLTFDQMDEQSQAIITQLSAESNLPLSSIKQALANNAVVETPTSSYDFQNVGGVLYRTDPTTGEAVRVGGGTSGGGGGSVASSGGANTTQLYTGLSSSTATAVRSLVNKYSSEPMVQNFATIQDGNNFAQSISNTTTNPADDQALIYSLAKALDPGSVVREGEYATAQKYAQSWVNAYGKGVTQAIAGTGFLSQSARQNIKQVIQSKYESSKRSYDQINNTYAQGISTLTGRGDGEQFLRDYVTPTSFDSAPPAFIPEGQIMSTITMKGADLDTNPTGFFESFLNVFGLSKK